MYDRIKDMSEKRLPYRIALAPMAGVTDHAFRKICAACGAEMMYTEMLSAKAIHFEDKKTAVLGELFDGEPTGVQIFGSEPLIMAEAAAKIADASYNHCRSPQIPLSIDINMGCPAPKVANNGEGSGLLRTPEIAEAIVREVKRSRPSRSRSKCASAGTTRISSAWSLPSAWKPPVPMR